MGSAVKQAKPILVGVISDTHGLLRPSAVAVLEGCDAIVHAGDVGAPEVLDELRVIAPLTVVWGNVDLGWARKLSEVEVLSIADTRILVIHDLNMLETDPREAGIDVVVSGHSHQPEIERRDGVLYVNPGSAGPRRFKLPIAVARIEIRAGLVEARIVELKE